MAAKVRIAPSVLSADLARLAEVVRAVEAGGADWLHCDVMDGHFVPNISFGPMLLEALRRISALPLDVHLMIADPDRYLEVFARAGAFQIHVHVEACVHLHRTVTRIRELGLRAGVAINPATPLGALEEILPEVDAVLLMSVDPGFGGQSLLPRTYERLRRLRELCRALGVAPLVLVDGGVDPRNAPHLVEAGADVLVAGHSVFAQADPEQAVRALREAAQQAFARWA
ncbi:MAG: ribulose-phosphate 3-epimerase [Bacteroidetes bacterium]|nr:ribulose-phosphate 3-epimerase [Rhodothermia bacterium]MCS7155109.1 ribulose-phosphate 3-epimerase [Bacteroidota bacterium]MCX7907215.1 ribulose-phosphate 3-epimerase [Bacteroidota bacterium]MDW8138714.1 ribulose-phosphate 3-epimerase [Bacteroidota bacterium]MDW8286049.1 ribulose-phosphate 3-epimerase [Bacteroidota bacterium]